MSGGMAKYNDAGPFVGLRVCGMAGLGAVGVCLTA